jgi:hypothetical protein
VIDTASWLPLGSWTGNAEASSASRIQNTIPSQTSAALGVGSVVSAMALPTGNTKVAIARPTAPATTTPVRYSLRDLDKMIPSTSGLVR